MFDPCYLHAMVLKSHVPAVAPFHFGLAEEFLFGCYHEPAGGRRRNCAVLICPPAGHEYVNCHRALRQLAARLSDAGFPVMRFDYYGCGDSSGNSDDGAVRRWLEDISSAITELRRRSSLAPICMIGARLGATLAMLSGAQRGDLESLVLWDPVVVGASHLKELQQLQKQMSRFRPRPKWEGKAPKTTEVLGFPIAPFLQAELERINLLAVEEPPAKNVLVIESYQREGNSGDGEQPKIEDHESPKSKGYSATVDPAALKDHLDQSVSVSEYQRVESPRIWLPAANGALLVPYQVLQSIVSWVSKTHS